MPLNKAASAVLETTKRESEARWDWVEASVWTERMLAALGNGVKGGKWPPLAKCLLRENRAFHHA